MKNTIITVIITAAVMTAIWSISTHANTIILFSCVGILGWFSLANCVEKENGLNHRPKR